MRGEVDLERKNRERERERGRKGWLGKGTVPSVFFFNCPCQLLTSNLDGMLVFDQG